MKKRYLFLKYIAIWLVACTGWVFAVEPLLQFLMPGIHHVEHWIMGVLVGVGLISLLVIILTIIALVRRSRRIALVGADRRS
jgi:hypothetical protein